MMRTLRVAHISDLHLSPVHRRVNIRKTKKLLDQINRLGVDHLVVTGDIVADAEPGELHLAKNLFRAYGFLEPGRMSVVVGNHDIYGGVHIAEDILAFPQRCSTADRRLKMRQFGRYFDEAFGNAVISPQDSLFPYLKQLPGVLLLGLDSVAEYSVLGNPVGSNGAVSEFQRKWIDQTLSSGKFRATRRIVMIHHHFNRMDGQTGGTIQGVWNAFERQTMKLRGKGELVQLFRRHAIDAVLHGHCHENMEYSYKGVRFANGGGSILGSPQSSLRVNLLSVGEAGIHIHRHEFPWTEETPASQALIPMDHLVTAHAAA